MKSFFKWFRLAALSVTLVIIGLALYVYWLDIEIRERIRGQWFLPPLEIYSAPLQITEDEALDVVVRHLRQSAYQQRDPEQKIRPNDFAMWSVEKCREHGAALDDADVSCLALMTTQNQFYILGVNADTKIHKIFAGQPPQPVDHAELSAQMFAQFYDNQPILRDLTKIGQIPLQCLQAVTAIEDSQFLQHAGFSVMGMGRALLRNLTNAQVREGGSTITQQLVKNYFLTSERSYRRKFKELFMAIVLEARFDKDQILENYLNVIYMGQNGPFQIRGYGAAAKHYFGKTVENLDLAECALLAAIVNSPGRFNPFTKAENALQRRALVLGKMHELNMLSRELAEEAKKSPLPVQPPRLLSEPAPYFVQAVIKELEKRNIDINRGLRVFTTMNEAAQEAAQVHLSSGLNTLEKQFSHLAKIKAKGKNLEGALISVDVTNGYVVALMGGRGYKQTQYNRAVEAHRQVGSVMKPVVYLTAFEQSQPNGQPYSPTTEIHDEPFTHEYHNQKWSPKNYDGQFSGVVPLYVGLKNSLNVATARLGLDVGLSSVVDMARRLGMTSKIEPFPAMTLGAFELYPWEVAQVYSTIARLGSKIELSYLIKVTDANGFVLYENRPSTDQVVAPENAAMLVSMMKQTLVSGTGASIPKRGFVDIAAGKTGTTSDTKDAWFAGFTPKLLTIVWIGYDDNTPHGLTGATGAIPIWTDYMKAVTPYWPSHDFTWPENTFTRTLSPEGPELVFRRGLEP